MSDEVALIKERLNLAEVIGEYVPLKRAGVHWKGLCPFHQEKTPSFVVSPDKGIWHCFGCNENGDVFTFVQRLEGLDFKSALKLLAERAGVTLAERISPAAGDSRGRLFELLGLVGKFYHEVLLHHRAGRQAKAYLQKRGVNEATMGDFLLGYAPMQWDVIQQFLEHKAFTRAEMVAAGLVGKNEAGRYFDRFRGRIMFPVHDVQGRVVAFGGRITPWHARGTEGKYVNSPETAIYQKRRVVYNVHRAKPAIRKQHLAIVVEGYLDTVMLSQAGVRHVVASSGTAFTAEHIEQLKRFTSTLHFAFDTDRAGIQAAVSATKAAMAAGMRVATILFPTGKDPADVALEEPAQLSQYIAHPQSLVGALLAQVVPDTTPHSREALVQEILPLIRQTTNLIQQGELVAELAAQLHVPEESITAQLGRLPAVTAAAISPDTTMVALNAPTTLTAEQRLVGLFIAESTTRGLLPNLTPELLTTPPIQELVGQLKAVLATSGATPLSGHQLINQLPESFVPLAEALRLETDTARASRGPTPEQEARDLLRFLRRRYLEGRLRSLQAELASQLPPPARALQQFQAVAEELEQVKGSVIT